MKINIDIGGVLIGIGSCLVLVAFGFFIQNQMVERHAYATSTSVAEQIDIQIKSVRQEQEQVLIPMELETEIQIEQASYIGILKIPQLALVLPIQSEWSYEKLRDTPCVYQGQISSGNLIVAGHNYQAHFGKLKNLPIDSEVIIEDAGGNQYHFKISQIEILEETDLETLQEGNWDLTLLTCNEYNNRERVIVCCTML